MSDKYTDLQLKIFKDRYAYQNEQTPDEMFRRVAVAVAEQETSNKQTWANEFNWLLKDFKYVPGGRILNSMGTDMDVTASNCYVLPSPEDSREGIMKSLRDWVEIQSKGGGVGINMSTLRPRGTPVGKNGTSSGPVNWSQPFAFMSKEVIIQGGSRRGAAMIMLNDNHPDIFEFIHSKEKGGVLEGCNISVCISDRFMKAVYDNAMWDLEFNGKVYSTVFALDLWQEICEAAHNSGEPGVYFMERANKEANSNYFEILISTNPCGEQPLGAYGACLLGSVNVANMLNDITDMDYDLLRKVVRLAVRFNDNVIDLSNYPLPECRESQQDIRRMGIGVMGLADLFLKLQIAYGSEESIELTENIYRTIRDEAYLASSLLAAERGSFPRYIEALYLNAPFVKKLPENIRESIARNGMRNCYLLTQAPTGTTSLLAGINSGIEPFFDFKYVREDRTGTTDIVHAAWEELYYSPERPDWLVATNDLFINDHINIQAAAQEYVDSSISKTINAPADADIHSVYNAYWEAYNKGLKSVAYYRDGSREEQVLYHKEPVVTNNVTSIQQPNLPVRRRLPLERKAITHKFQVGEQEGYMTVGLFDDGTPGEVFIHISKQGSTVSGLMDSVAMLTSYSLQYGVPISELTRKLKGTRFEPSGSTNNKEIPITTSIIDYIFRWLENRFGTVNTTQVQLQFENMQDILIDTKSQFDLSGETCPDCGGIMIHSEGCLLCRECGYNKCG